MPGLVFRPSRLIFSTVRPLTLSRRFVITSSFSSGAKVHVEYTMVPPGFKACIAFVVMCFWSLERPCIRVSLHLERTFQSFLIVPSAEQGASRSILSNCMWEAFSFAASILVTMVFIMPLLSRLYLRAFMRDMFESFAIMRPVFCIISAIWVVFEPGAAHVSSIVSSFLGSSTSGGIMEEASCT